MMVANHDILYLTNLFHLYCLKNNMSSQFYSESGSYDDTEIVTIYDSEGRSLDCYVENEVEYNQKTYVLLMPIDLAIVILKEQNLEHVEETALYAYQEMREGETIIVEDTQEVKQIFDDAKAVLGELNLYLKHTGFMLSASGELPPLEEDNIISLELEEDNSDIEADELQFLASFYSQKQKYNLCTPLSPLLFIGQRNSQGKIDIFQDDDDRFSFILEELLFDDYDEN